MKSIGITLQCTYLKRNYIRKYCETSRKALEHSCYSFQFCINIEINNHTFKQTRDYNREIKQKPFRQIQSHSCIFQHIQASSGIIQAYSESCIILAYSEPWYIQTQNRRHIQNPIKHLGWSILERFISTAIHRPSKAGGRGGICLPKVC